MDSSQEDSFYFPKRGTNHQNAVKLSLEQNKRFEVQGDRKHLRGHPKCPSRPSGANKLASRLQKYRNQPMESNRQQSHINLQKPTESTHSSFFNSEHPSAANKITQNAPFDFKHPKQTLFQIESQTLPFNLDRPKLGSLQSSELSEKRLYPPKPSHTSSVEVSVSPAQRSSLEEGFSYHSSFQDGFSRQGLKNLTNEVFFDTYGVDGNGGYNSDYDTGRAVPAAGGADSYHNCKVPVKYDCKEPLNLVKPSKNGSRAVLGADYAALNSNKVEMIKTVPLAVGSLFGSFDSSTNPKKTKYRNKDKKSKNPKNPGKVELEGSFNSPKQLKMNRQQPPPHPQQQQKNKINLNLFKAQSIRRESWGIQFDSEAYNSKPISSSNVFTLGRASNARFGNSAAVASKQQNPPKELNLFNSVSSVDSKCELFGDSLPPITQYGNEDPEIISVFRIWKDGKIQKNGTFFSKLCASRKGGILAANTANVFRFNQGNSINSYNWNKGKFLMQGNYQELFGMWELELGHKGIKLLLLVKIQNQVKLQMYDKASGQLTEVTKFSYNPFHFENYRNSLLISHEINSAVGERPRRSPVKSRLVFLRESENRISVFNFMLVNKGNKAGAWEGLDSPGGSQRAKKKREKGGVIEVEKIGVCLFEVGLCIKKMLFIRSEGCGKGCGNLWIFFTNGMYAIEQVDLNEAEKYYVSKRRDEGGSGRGNGVPVQVRDSLVPANVIHSECVPIPLPMLNINKTELISSIMTIDGKWLLCSIYQKQNRTNFVVLYKRVGNRVEFLGKIRVQRFQGESLV